MIPLRLGTRSSRLALWQAGHVADLLRAFRPVELVAIQTRGDRDSAASLAQIGGQGVFTKEIQRALLDGRVDLAVHSLKDLPTAPVPGLTLAAVPPRGPTGDALVSRNHIRLDDLPAGARVASGSVRRQAMLLNRRPDLVMIDVRGNVDTRLARLDSGHFDALVLAEAGLRRLGFDEHITEVLDTNWMLPAIGQGALGIECRADDAATLELLQTLDDAETRAAVTAERSLLFHLGGGCQVPLGAVGTVRGDELTLQAVVLSRDGSLLIGGELQGRLADATVIGQQLSEQLLSRGAAAFLTAD